MRRTTDSFVEGSGLVRFETGSGISFELWAPMVGTEIQSWGALKAIFRQ